MSEENGPHLPLPLTSAETGSGQTAENVEKALARTAADLDRIWRNSRDLITVIDLKGTLRAVNPAAQDVLGWSQEEMLGRPVMDFIHPDDRPPVRDGSLIAERYAAPRIFLNRFLHKDGSYRHMSWLANSSEDGLIYSSGRDLTGEREQARALEAAQERLRQSQKMEAVGQLTGGIAHDFNNLLTGITGSLEIMQARISQGRLEDIDRYIDQAHGAAKRAAALTHRLLSFSRRQTLDPKPMNPIPLIGGMAELIGRTAGPAVELDVAASGAPWPILVDQNQLENALLNLCLNARDAMPDGGRITVATANVVLGEAAAKDLDLPAGEYLSLSVSDTGAGMTADVMDQAFDPFFTTKPLGLGTGLGLSMVYGFVRQSGGQVAIASEPDMGATVTIFLPRFIGEVEESDEVARAVVEAQAGDGETVLVVDDEPLVRMLVVEVLQEAGYRTLEADDGRSGLKILESTARIDLLVSDVGLPGGMNGRQMADAARVRRPDLKVLFITGYAANAVMGKGQLDQGMAVLVKPFDLEELGAKVHEMMHA
jgi:PAS domain S-box-containing protein